MKIKFKDSKGARHEWDFVMPTVSETIVIEDELDMGAVDFMEAVGALRGRALRLLLRLLYKREGLDVPDEEIDGGLDDFEIEETAKERKQREKEEAEEAVPAIAALLKEFGVNITAPSVMERLTKHMADEGKGAATLAGGNSSRRASQRG